MCYVITFDNNKKKRNKSEKRLFKTNNNAQRQHTKILK